MDIRFYWVRDRVNQDQFIVYWRPEADNLGDYHTKHHPSSHHIKVRSNYIHDLPQLLNIIMRGCVIVTKTASVLNVLSKKNIILNNSM